MQLLDKYTTEGLNPPPGLDEVADNTGCIQLVEKIIGSLDDMCSNPKVHWVGAGGWVQRHSLSMFVVCVCGGGGVVAPNTG